MNNLKIKYKQDLEYMLEKYQKYFVAPYYCFRKKELEKYINKYLNTNQINNDYDFFIF